MLRQLTLAANALPMLWKPTFLHFIGIMPTLPPIRQSPVLEGYRFAKANPTLAYQKAAMLHQHWHDISADLERLPTLRRCLANIRPMLKYENITPKCRPKIVKPTPIYA